MKELLRALFDKKVELEAKKSYVEQRSDAEAIDAAVAEYRAKLEEEAQKVKAEELVDLGYQLRAIDSLIADEEARVPAPVEEELAVEDPVESFQPSI